jgi:hypothetical protein
MIEEKKRKLTPGEIGLNVKDTGFLLAILNRASIQGSELKHAMAVTTKIEKLHDYIINQEEVIRGIH